ncbi:MAG: glycoside hydrolase family 97 C-terminal domain-containing protein, partial [Cyclobacteriaceae bacterium]|nr:glycoside hydrolase family 97 C-terminal domain-containing protein [Cyclobacteriaceae bacterium]
KWSGLVNPEHNVTIPFIRMAAGPMDFTPGAMFNMNKGSFASLFSRPMAYGTRTHQVAMYVVYEAPLQMMCESPTVYYQEKETVDFITQIPTIWDETVVLKGSVGNYIAVARRKGNDWYIGAMTDWDSRAMELDFSFLGEGNYRMESMRDGINAGRNAQDYKMEKSTVTSNSKIQIHLSGGGGWVAIIKKMN